MDGSDKRVPPVIRKSAGPGSFKNAARIPVKYVANTKAWMTRSIFVEWLNELNNDMKNQRRNGLELSNVQVHFFPAHCTSLIQPLDQGVINSVKFAYRRCLIDRFFLNLRLNLPTKVEVSHAVEMLSAAWQSTGAVIIANCFRKTGLGLCEQETAAETETVQPGLVQAWESLMDWEGAVPAGVELSDYINGDSCVVATEELDDDDDSVCDTGDAGDTVKSDGPNEEPPPTAADVLKSIDTLRRYATAQENQERAVEAIWTYERCVLPTLTRTVQAKLTDYFVRP
ncbi:tigger transposable element-derived protein 6-like [Ornithodoros turicata]|uniref:tigger transposable element-derived protein 6-like n=1 Tax=Ornithodoros turicata TaxID=34597 RepID=UPI0031390AEB